jgi:hypothetical protein
MAATIQGQQTYNQFPAFAQPGQLADLAYAEIVSFPAAAIVQPGCFVEVATDGLSCQMLLDAVQTQLSTVMVGMALLITARESSGAFNITPYGVGGPQYNIGDSVPVLMRGRAYALWKGTTQTAFNAALHMYNDATDVAHQGVLTDAAVTGTPPVVGLAGVGVRGRQVLSGSGNIILVDINLPGAVS